MDLIGQLVSILSSSLMIVIRCIEVVKNSVHSELTSELEITKALTFLREKDLPRVRMNDMNTVLPLLLLRLLKH